MICALIDMVARDLTSTYVRLARFSKAEEVFRRTEHIPVESARSERNRAMRAEMLGGIYAAEGKHSIALPLYEQAFEIWKRLADPDSMEDGIASATLGLAYSQVGRYDDALRNLIRAENILARVAGPRNSMVALCFVNEADVRTALGDYPSALELQKRAIPILERNYGPDHPVLADVLERHALTLKASGNKKAAKNVETQAATIKSAAAKRTGSGQVVDIRTLAMMPE